MASILGVAMLALFGALDAAATARPLRGYAVPSVDRVCGSQCHRVQRTAHKTQRPRVVVARPASVARTASSRAVRPRGACRNGRCDVR